MSKLQISDLLNTITNNQNTNTNDKKTSKVSKATEQFLVQGNMKVKKIKKNQEVTMKRQLNYKATQQDMDKWLGIVKLNRQKQTLDLTRKQKDSVKINFFPSKPTSQLQAKTQKILGELSMRNQTAVMKAQQIQLNKLDPQQAKKRLVQARKHRTAVFYEEIKRRRISKIKSKLYHRIKKRQKLRQQQKAVQNMDIHQRSQYIQKLTKKRIKQRINLRHNSKNKHIQNLLRFSKFNKDGIQTAINEVNLIRQKQLEKNKIDDELLNNISEQYDDENYRQQAIMDLQNQLAQMQQNEDKQQGLKGLDNMKFMKVARQKQRQKDMNDAYKLINKLENDQSQEIAIDSDSEVADKPQKAKQSQQVTRKVYGQGKQERKDVGKKQFIKKNINQALNNYGEQLTKGISIQNLKQKYQPQRIDLRLNQQLLEQNRDIFNEGNNLAAQNLRQFQQDKYRDMQQDIEPQKKKVQGWGSWAGPNIKAKAVDPQVEIKRKLAKIQQIKLKRRDGSLSNVVVNQVRNKNLKDYMVRRVPHQFVSAQQFQYVNNQDLGPEWNSLTQFKANIKPKVITKVGEIIEPVKVPRNINK